MNKAELAAVISEKVGVTKKQADDMLDVFVNTTMDALQQNHEVTIAGFGTFSAFIRKAREGVNPQKISEKIHIGPTKVAKFKAGSTLKSAMKRSHAGAAAGVTPQTPTTPAA
jgi:nucleoid DNA-binding protein